MSTTNDLSTATIRELARAIEARELSPTTLATLMLDRISKLDPELRAFNEVTSEQALARAAEAEQEIAAGNYRGPLHGIPVGLKDLLQTRDVRTTVSSRMLGDWVPTENATVVERLEAAGATPAPTRARTRTHADPRFWKARSFESPIRCRTRSTTSGS